VNRDCALCRLRLPVWEDRRGHYHMPHGVQQRCPVEAPEQLTVPGTRERFVVIETGPVQLEMFRGPVVPVVRS